MSLPLQIFVYFNGWYDAIWAVIMLALFIWKGTQLPWPAELGRELTLEVCLVFIVVLIEWARLFLASQGNKTERWLPLFFSIVLALPSAYLIFIYFLYQQIYVTRLDVILGSVGIGFIGIEVLLSLIVICTLSADECKRTPRAS